LAAIWRGFLVYISITIWGKYSQRFGRDDEIFTEQHGDMEYIFPFVLEGGLLGSM